MQKEVVLFLAPGPGPEVIEAIQQTGDLISAVFVTDEPAKAFLSTRFPALNVQQVTKHQTPEALFPKGDPDFLVTAYWPWILDKSVFQRARVTTINFHPALLPKYRGWYPHVHNILEKSQAGVTLHMLAEGADTGPIWAQKGVDLFPWDTAKEIHERLQREICNLFKATWPKIRNMEIDPTPQDESQALYKKKSDIAGLDHIDLQKSYRAEELINLLRARSFGRKGFAYFEKDGQRVYLNLKLALKPDFE